MSVLGQHPNRESARLALGLLAASFLLPTSAAALPADAYHVEQISHPGATTTRLRGVDETGRALVYWARFDSTPPLPIGAPPDEEGYTLWQGGIETPLSIPGLTNARFDHMNAAGDIWGRADEGAFVYNGAGVQIVEGTGADLTVVQGVDGAGLIYGFLADYPPGVDPDDLIVPIDVVSTFLYTGGNFETLDLGLDGAVLGGVLQDSTLWGSTNTDSFILGPLGTTTILSHPDEDYTGIHGLTSDIEAFGFASTSDGMSYSSLTYFWHPDSGFTNWPDDATLPGTDLRPHSMNELGVFWGTAEPNVAFAAFPLPEPGTGLLLGTALLAGCRFRRTR